MAHIDSTITSISDNERAVIEKYGFELRDQNGQYDLIDPEIRKVRGITASRHIGGNLSTLLHDAVSVRKQHEEAMSNGGTQTDVKPVTETSPTGVVHNPETLEVTQPKSTKKPAKAKADPKVKPAKAKNVEPATEIEAPKNRVVRLSLHLKPPSEISDAELDNTGKRERASRKEVKASKEPKANRYERAANAIIGNPKITADKLAREAHMSVSMAAYCIAAWEGVTKVLTEKGWLKLPSSSK